MPRKSSVPSRKRRLWAERLEPRQMCAADWQNPVNHLDVNQSGSIEPIDALLVINELNRLGKRAFPAKSSDYSGPLRDVNGDNFESVLDVLLVINSLNTTDAGDLAPQVRLPNQKGELVDVSSLIGKNAVVLYFYPKDNTPGCTVEALDFSAKKAEIESLGAKIFGVSLDTVGSHDDFATKHELSFDILADAERTATKAYSVLTQTSTGDPIARRTTFIIGIDGHIKKVFTDVQVSSHGADVVAALRSGIAN